MSGFDDDPQFEIIMMPSDDSTEEQDEQDEQDDTEGDEQE